MWASSANPKSRDSSNSKRTKLWTPANGPVHTKRSSVEFVQAVTDPSSGYAYRYRTVVRLSRDQPQMAIEHSLKNVGKRFIETKRSVRITILAKQCFFFPLNDFPPFPDLVLSAKTRPPATLDWRRYDD